jgi:peptidoglycan hydrolase-like protein with peptidoglycan-binding domain
MVKKAMLLGLAAIFVFSLSGCSMLCKNKELEIQGLKNQVTALESQLRAKDEKINSSRESLVRSSGELSVGAGQIAEVKQHPDIKQIQQALKNAGYYQGVVDGVMGKSTHRAVKAFQKANNLFADGRVGKKTWIVLKDYLEKKVK